MLKLETKAEAPAFCLTLETKNLDNLFLLLEASKAIESYRPQYEGVPRGIFEPLYVFVHSWPKVYMNTVETTVTGAYEIYHLYVRTYIDYDPDTKKFGVVVGRDCMSAMGDCKNEGLTKKYANLIFDEAVEIGTKLHDDLQIEAVENQED